MDAKTYLESGILELYAAGALSLSECAEVEDMAARHPEIADELKRTREAMAWYGMSQELAPRPALRAAVMDSINGTATSQVPGKASPRQSSATLAYKYLLAACLASLVISTFASYFFYNRWSEAEDQNIELLGEKNTLTQNYAAVKSAFDKTYGDMLVIQDLNTRSYNLNATDTSQTYAVRVYWNPMSHETYLDIHFLPVLTADKQYQLWAMAGGKYVDAGVFSVTTEGGLQPMKSIFEADGWVISIEPLGGSKVPTLTALALHTKKPTR